MKKKDLLEFRKKSISENRKKMAVAISKIAELRVEFKAGKVKGPKKIKKKKKDIAQMKTIIREKEIIENKTKSLNTKEDKKEVK